MKRLHNHSPKPYILAVDDEPINRLVLEDLIDERYELEMLEDGKSCLDSVNHRIPELILLDINMPGMDGFEVCRQLKSNPVTEAIPVIFLTAKITIEDERKGLMLGAVDYITKPFTETILLARIKTHLALNKARRELEHTNDLLQKERNYIEFIMQTMREDSRYTEQHLAVLTSPVESSNGDMVLSVDAANGHRHILIADFTGHGLPAAIAGPLVGSLFYSQAEQAISLMSTADMINAELVQKLPPEVFMAVIFIDWDIANQQMLICNRGMPPLLHFRDGECLAEYPSTGYPLGIDSTTTFCDELHAVQVNANDVLFAFSDGIGEVVISENEDRIDLSRLTEMLRKLMVKKETLQQFEQQLLDVSHAGFDDDTTLVQINVP